MRVSIDQKRLTSKHRRASTKGPTIAKISSSMPTTPCRNTWLRENSEDGETVSHPLLLGNAGGSSQSDFDKKGREGLAERKIDQPSAVISDLALHNHPLR